MLNKIHHMDFICLNFNALKGLYNKIHQVFYLQIASKNLPADFK